LSEIRAAAISNEAGSGPITLTGQAATRAMCSVNQVGTISTRSSLNVSSLTDVIVGHSTVTYTNAFVSALYGATQGGGNNGITAGICRNLAAYSTTSIRMDNITTSGTFADLPQTDVFVIGDLA